MKVKESATGNIVLHITSEDGVNIDKGGPTKIMLEFLKGYDCLSKLEPLPYCIWGVFSARILKKYSDLSQQNNIVGHSVKCNYPRFYNLARNVYYKILRLRIVQVLSPLLGMIYLFYSMLKLIPVRPYVVLIHAHDFFAAYTYIKLFKWLFRKPCILTLHSKGSAVINEFSPNNVILKYFMLHMETCAVRTADFITFPSQGAEEAMCNDISDVKFKKRTVIHNGYSPEPNNSNILTVEAKAVLEQCRKKKIILTVAALRYQKGIDVLVKAFSLLDKNIAKDAILLIVGDGPERNNIESLLSKLTEYHQALLINKLARSDITELMKHADIFVLPHRVSIFDYALLEAMAHRLPVITTNVGGNLEMFKEKGTAVFVEKEDAVGLADAISGLITNTDLKNTLRHFEYAHYLANFTADKMCKKYIELYKTTLPA